MGKLKKEKTEKALSKEERAARRKADRAVFLSEIRETVSGLYEKRFILLAWLGVIFSLSLASMFFTGWTRGEDAGYPWLVFNAVTRTGSLILVTLFGIFTPFRKTVFAVGAAGWAVWMLLLSDVSYGAPAIVFVAGIAVAGVFLKYEIEAFKKGAVRETPAYAKEWAKYFYFTAALTVVIELVGSLRFSDPFFNISAPFVMLVSNPDRFVNNVLIVFFTGLITRVCPRRKFATTLFSAIWILLAFISMLKITNVYEPLMLLDVFSTVDMISVVTHYFRWYFFVVMALALAALIAALVWLSKKEKKTHVGGGNAFIAIVLAAVTLASFALSSSLPYAEFTEDLNIENFYRQGFAASFARTAAGYVGKKPDNYSEDTFQKISETVEKEFEKPESAKVANIIVIQMESFCDPSDLSAKNPELVFGEDPIPFLTSLKNTYSSGKVEVPVYAGQTVKSEFEFLTGVDLDCLPDGLNPYVTNLPSTEIDSIARYLASKGFTTAGIHNYQGEFFSRHLVYENLGFEYFVPVECMQNTERRGTELWSADSVLPGEIAKALGVSTSRKFIFTVSTQLHGDYPVLDESEYTMDIAGLEYDEELEGQVQYYVSQLREFDSVIRSIVEMLEKKGEPTILLLYSDHLPKFANKVCDLSNDETFETGYYIWDNIGLRRETEDLPLYMLSTKLLRKAGLEGDFINRFHSVYCAKDANEYREASTLVGYKLIFDPGEELFGSGRKITYGFESPEILDIRRDVSGDSYANSYILTAVGLTDDTVITVNGKVYNLTRTGEYEAEFETGRRPIEEGDAITLRILGERLGTVFRESRETIFSMTE